MSFYSEVERVWKKSQKSSPFTMWQLGDEIWEMKGDTLRHFKIVSRVPVQEEIREVLVELPESPIPLEALRSHRVSGWEVVQTQYRQPLKSGQSPLPPLQNSKKVELPAPVVVLKKKSSSNQTSREKLRLLEQESVVTGSSQDSEVHPTLLLQPQALWSSLSQWIPQHALFQPSLHHQAYLELSELPVQVSAFQKGSSHHLHAGQGQRLNVNITPHRSTGKPRSQKPSHVPTVVAQPSVKA